MSKCVTHFACDCITEKLIKFEKAEAENKVLREALEFYKSGKCLYITGEINTSIADQALAESEKIKNGK